MRNRFPCHIFFTPSWRFGKVHISWFLFCSDKFHRWLQPLTRQGMHLAVALENSTLCRILNISSTCFQVSLKLWVSLDFSDAIGLFADEELVGTWEDKLIAVDFDFATLRFFPFLLLNPFFAIVLGQAYQAGILSAASRAEMADVETNQEDCSSRVKLPLVKLSTSWCLVSMYRIWILESRLILSNSQSKATLWVLDTCLIEGIRPLIIILITASFSSKDIQRSIGTRMCSAWWTMINIGQIEIGVRGWNLFSHVWHWELPTGFTMALTSLVLLVWFGEVWNTSFFFPHVFVISLHVL